MITINDIIIEKICSKHHPILKKFQCYEKDLVDFLLEDAIDNQDKKISTTHLWFLKDKKVLIGYITKVI